MLQVPLRMAGSSPHPRFVPRFPHPTFSSGSGVHHSPLFFLKWFRPKKAHSWNGPLSPPPEDEPEDVAQERALVDAIPADGGGYAIVAKGLQKHFPPRGGRPGFKACKSLSVAIEKGCCFGMLGPNGGRRGGKEGGRGGRGCCLTGEGVRASGAVADLRPALGKGGLIRAQSFSLSYPPPSLPLLLRRRQVDLHQHAGRLPGAHGGHGRRGGPRHPQRDGRHLPDHGGLPSGTITRGRGGVCYPKGLKAPCRPKLSSRPLFDGCSPACANVRPPHLPRLALFTPPPRTPQHDLLWETLTAREHLMFYGRLKNLSGAALTSAVDALLRKVTLIRLGL